MKLNIRINDTMTELLIYDSEFNLLYIITKIVYVPMCCNILKEICFGTIYEFIGGKNYDDDEYNQKNGILKIKDNIRFSTGEQHNIIFCFKCNIVYVYYCDNIHDTGYFIWYGASIKPLNNEIEEYKKKFDELQTNARNIPYRDVDMRDDINEYVKLCGNLLRYIETMEK